MGPIVLSIIFVIVFTILLIMYLWISEYLELHQTLAFIPGPRNYPFIGLSWQMKRVPRQDRFQWFNDLCFSYKDGMVVTWFGIEPVVNIRKPRQMEMILSSERYISKTRFYKILTPWLGNGLLTSTDDIWFYHRHIVTNGFQYDMLDQYIDVINEKIEILIECIQAKVILNLNAPINVLDFIRKYSFDTLSETIIGVPMDTQRKSNNSYFREFCNFYCLASDKYFDYWIKSYFHFGDTNNKREYFNSIHSLQKFTEKVIKEKQMSRRQKNVTIAVEANEIPKSERKAYLDYLLDSSESAKFPLTLQEIREEIDTLMFAGHRTTSAAISWTLFSLGNAKKIQANVHKELKKVFRDNEEPATADKLQQLKYLDRVIKEVLRLYPSVPLIGRTLDNDIVIDNCFIPKGTVVHIQIYQLHHDPEVWEDPDVFDPDRFLPENSNRRHPLAYIPFSTGPRICVGQNFAILEIKLAITAILRKWRVKSALKPRKIKIISDFTLRPFNNNIELYFIPKNK